MMTPARRWDYSVILDCERPGKRCRIFLPRQIRSGTPVYQHYQPKDGWPATFLCLQHGIPSVRHGTDVRRDICRPDPREPVPPLWRIVCECAHENCGERHTIYLSEQPDRESIWRGISGWNPKIPCGSHFLVWQEHLIEYEMIAQDSPVR
jgi:hypothetical protein